METKFCPDCQQELPIEQFSLKGGGKRRTYCKKCTNIRDKPGRAAYLAMHGDEYKAWQKARHAQNRAAFASGDRSYPATKRCPHCKRVLGSDRFYLNHNNTDGLDMYCTQCRHDYSEAQRKRR